MMQIGQLVRALAAVALMFVGTAGTLSAQRAPSATPPQAVVQQARVSKDAATATAAKAVPGGKVQTIGLGAVAGKLAYTAFVTVAGKPGRTTVVVDAMTGAVLSKR
jgi:uncharacterized membrane protein YkoI